MTVRRTCGFSQSRCRVFIHPCSPRLPPDGLPSAFPSGVLSRPPEPDKLPRPFPHRLDLPNTVAISLRLPAPLTTEPLVGVLRPERRSTFVTGFRKEAHGPFQQIKTFYTTAPGAAGLNSSSRLKRQRADWASASGHLPCRCHEPISPFHSLYGLFGYAQLLPNRLVGTALIPQRTYPLKAFARGLTNGNRPRFGQSS
jgi:hypothetical protein